MTASASCQNCRHRVEVAVAVSAWVDLTKPHCRKFVHASFDPGNGETVTPLPCQKTMSDFCGLGDWKPTIMHRMKAMLTVPSRVTMVRVWKREKRP